MAKPIQSCYREREGPKMQQPNQKPTPNSILLLTARFETIAMATGKRIVPLGDVFLCLEPAFQLETPHPNYGLMIKITATRIEDGEFAGHLFRIAADENFPNSISVGGAFVRASWRRLGVATALYDFAEEIAVKCNARLVASDLLSDDAKAFWVARLSSKNKNNRNR
jgi:GNAT superfamily N-acetyltransferase